MDTETVITCHCGQIVQEKDILQHGRFPRLMSPGFLYVKFRCPRCKRLGERFVPQGAGSGRAARAGLEISGDDAIRFKAMGDIELDEVIDFHFQLESRPLRDLVDSSDG
ncbi:MAG TPA: hypothetical protein VGM51_10405 [Armatimonadota bacterium]|jgi:hypothetical protein